MVLYFSDEEVNLIVLSLEKLRRETHRVTMGYTRLHNIDLILHKFESHRGGSCATEEDDGFGD